MTPEQREKHLNTIEKIEGMKRPIKWREIKKFLLSLHPEFIPIDKGFCEAVKEIREVSTQTASTKSGELRQTMKIPQYIYNAINALDPEVLTESSGKNKGLQQIIGKELWKAFPEYRIARTW